jgi:hypothetical protein
MTPPRATGTRGGACIMRNLIGGGLAAAALTAGALSLTACGGGGGSAPGAASPLGAYDDGHSAAGPRPYSTCVTVLQKLHATPWGSTTSDPATPTSADGKLADGTQVQCHIGPPFIPGYYPPQTAYGNGWQVDVFGATTTATVAAELGGTVGTS